MQNIMMIQFLNIIIFVTPLLSLMSHTDIPRHNIETCACMNMYAYFQVKVDDYGYTHFTRIVLGIGSSSAGSFVNTHKQINKFLYTNGLL